MMRREREHQIVQAQPPGLRSTASSESPAGSAPPPSQPAGLEPQRPLEHAVQPGGPSFSSGA